MSGYLNVPRFCVTYEVFQNATRPNYSQKKKKMCEGKSVINKSSLHLLDAWAEMHLAHQSRFESSLQIPSVFHELQKATRNVRVTVGPVFLLSWWGWCGSGAALARTRRWEGGGLGGVVCPMRQMARGAGPWWAGAGWAPCAVVGNWGPGWNVGGTLILSATVFLRHRSPLPPPICSFHCSDGKCPCTHLHVH